MAGLSKPRHLAIVYRPADRPQTRGDCLSGERPCPYISCRYHLATDGHHGEWRVNVWMHLRIMLALETGRPMKAPTCALDIADSGESTVEEISTAMGLWHTNVPHTIRYGLEKAQNTAESLGLDLTMLADEPTRIRSPR